MRNICISSTETLSKLTQRPTSFSGGLDPIDDAIIRRRIRSIRIRENSDQTDENPPHRCLVNAECLGLSRLEIE